MMTGSYTSSLQDVPTATHKLIGWPNATTQTAIEKRSAFLHCILSSFYLKQYKLCLVC